MSRSGWEALTALDVLFLITALFGLAAAVTGGRFGFFRPDVSLNGATDIVALVATILLTRRSNHPLRMMPHHVRRP